MQEYKFTSDWFSFYVPRWFDIFSFLRPTRILEIGSYEGRSAVWMSKTMASLGLGGVIVCVDTWEDREIEERFDSNISLASKDNILIQKHKGNSQDIMWGTVTGKYDFIYVDGSHIACDVLTDAVSAFYLCRHGGVIIFDDYGGGELGGSPQDSPRIAIDAFLKCFKHEIEIIHKDYQVAVRKK